MIAVVLLFGVGFEIGRQDDGTSKHDTAAVATSASHRASTSSSASTASDSAATPSSGGTGFTPQPVDWQSCGRGDDCATLDVPIDYQDPTGPTVPLALIRQPAKDAAHKLGSLLVNPGGPGGSGVEFVREGGLGFSSDIADRFDIVGFDPRGVGASAQLACGDATNDAFHKLDPGPDNATEQTELDDAAKAIADDCAAHAGPLLAHVGTDDVVRDMDSIRAAVGDEKLSFLGYSYGTLLGLRYAELFPTHVRAIVVDGVVDPTQDFEGFLRDQTIAFEKQLTITLDACPASDSGCPAGGASAAYDQIAAEVETNPIAVGSRQLGPNELATAAIYSAYAPSFASQLYRALDAAQQGNGKPLLQMNDGYEGSVHFASYAAVECIDSPHPEGADAYKAFADELTQLSPRFGPSVANELLACAFWPAPVQSVVGAVHAHGAPPLLVIGTTGDAATPYENAVRVAHDLEQSRLLTVNGTGHTSGENACAQAATASYLIDLTLPDEGAQC